MCFFIKLQDWKKIFTRGSGRESWTKCYDPSYFKLINKLLHIWLRTTWTVKQTCNNLYPQLFTLHQYSLSFSESKQEGKRDVTACWDMQGVRSGNISQTVLWLSAHIREDSNEHKNHCSVDYLSESNHHQNPSFLFLFFHPHLSLSLSITSSFCQPVKKYARNGFIAKSKFCYSTKKSKNVSLASPDSQQ